MRHRTKNHKRKYTKRIQKTKNKLKFSKYKGKKTKKHKKTNKTKKNRKGGTRPIRKKKPPTRYAQEFAQNKPITKRKAKPKKESKAKPKKESEDKPKKKRKPNFYFYYKRLLEGRKAERDARKNIKRLQEVTRQRELDKMETRASRVWDYDEEEPGEPIGPIEPIFTIRDTVEKYINLYKNAFPIGELKKFSKNDFKNILFANILEDYERNDISFDHEEKSLILLLIDENVDRMLDENFKTEDINLTDEELINLIKQYEKEEQGKGALESIQEDSNEENSSGEDSSEEDDDFTILLDQLPEGEE